MAFTYLQGWRLHNPHDQCVTVLSHPHSNNFLTFRQQHLYFPLYPLPLVLSWSINEKSLAPSSVHPLQVFIYIVKISLCAFLLHAEEFQLPQPFPTPEMLQSLNHPFVFTVLFPACPCLFYWGAQNSSQSYRHSLSTCAEGMHNFPRPADKIPHNAAQVCAFYEQGHTAVLNST